MSAEGGGKDGGLTVVARDVVFAVESVDEMIWNCFGKREKLPSAGTIVLPAMHSRGGLAAVAVATRAIMAANNRALDMILRVESVPG
jgi:hypothetical protein